jgi:predicted site-specific integrase-resolvase
MHTTKDAAEALQLQPRTVKRYCWLGLIRAKKVGRDWLITQREIERFARERRKPGERRK